MPSDRTSRILLVSLGKLNGILLQLLARRPGIGEIVVATRNPERALAAVHLARFLRRVRELTRDRKILMIMDETVTGFRVAAGGCAELYDVQPDLTTFGKALGCGYPVAAISGPAEIMDGLRWGVVLHYGTQNAPRLGLHIVQASLDELTRDDNYGFRRLHQLGEKLEKGIAGAIEASGVKAIVQGVGPMLQMMFTEQPRHSQLP